MQTGPVPFARSVADPDTKPTPAPNVLNPRAYTLQSYRGQADTFAFGTEENPTQYTGQLFNINDMIENSADKFNNGNTFVDNAAQRRKNGILPFPFSPTPVLDEKAGTCSGCQRLFAKSRIELKFGSSLVSADNLYALFMMERKLTVNEEVHNLS